MRPPGDGGVTANSSREESAALRMNLAVRRQLPKNDTNFMMRGARTCSVGNRQDVLRQAVFATPWTHLPSH